MQVRTKNIQSIVIRFAGDSGDGIQVAGNQFAITSVDAGLQAFTAPEYPAEIRAPAGTRAGVSGIQVAVTELPTHTAGDQADVLVAMNPAALVTHLPHLQTRGLLLINEDGFNDRGIQKAGLDSDPLDDEFRGTHQVIRVPMTTLVTKVLRDLDLPMSKVKQCKNVFALGMVYWLYHLEQTQTQTWLQEKFQDDPLMLTANQTALKAGYEYAERCELIKVRYSLSQDKPNPNVARRPMTGNEAFALGALTAAHKLEKPLFVAGYPITPASTLLQAMTHYTHCGVRAMQAEDEMAAIGAALGASFTGALAMTCTSGPGMDLKAEGIGLGVSAELPVVIVDVQRAGPSTGMPTRPAQADLGMALHGRHGSCPVPVLAPATPSDCYSLIIKAFEFATLAMTPVIVLSDAALAGSAENWSIPNLDDIEVTPIRARDHEPPFSRCEESLTRPWVIPGTPDNTYCIGGLEKHVETGEPCYDGDNHALMNDTRARKIASLARVIPRTDIEGEASAKHLVISWGSTYGAVAGAVAQLNREHSALAHVHLRYLNPLPSDLGAIIAQYPSIIVMELNEGQCHHYLQGTYGCSLQSYAQNSGQTFKVSKLVSVLKEFLHE